MQKTSATLRRTVLLGIRLAVRFLIALSVLSFVTVLIWIILNFRSMGKVMSYVSMGPASAVITTVVSLGWLPNLMVWALSWLLGSGIVIGNVGVFTLWESGSTALPVIPVFGILPKSLSSQNVIIAILIIPIIIAFLLGLQTISSRRGFNLFSGRDIRQEDTELKLPGIIGQASHDGHNDGEEAGLETAADPDPGADQEDHGTARQDYPRSAAVGTAVIAKLVDFAYAAGAFVVAIITVICVSTLFYMLSSGSLGVKTWHMLESTCLIPSALQEGRWCGGFWRHGCCPLALYAGNICLTFWGLIIGVIRIRILQTQQIPRNLTVPEKPLKEGIMADPHRPIHRVIVSVFDKKGLETLAEAFIAAGTEVVSTGSTALRLEELGVEVTPVEKVTGLPESLDGRVKTLDPHIHAGILAYMENPGHTGQLEALGIKALMR